MHRNITGEEEEEKDEERKKSIALVFVHEDAQMERKQINLRSITDVTLVQVDAAFAFVMESNVGG